MGRCESQESLRGGNEVNDKNKPSSLMAKIYETSDKTIDNLQSINMSPEEEEKKRKLERNEMRVLRWAMSVAFREHLRNEDVRSREEQSL